jgi:hypothetical protein
MIRIVFASLFLILISCNNLPKNNSANETKVIKTEVVDTAIEKSNYAKDSTLTDEENIEIIFTQFRNHKKSTNEKLICSFDYKKGAEPDVDVFDSRFQLIFSVSKNKFIEQIIKQFQSICEHCDESKSSLTAFQKEIFFVKGTYLVNVNHQTINNETTQIICLIYGNGRYAFFTLGYLLK